MNIKRSFYVPGHKGVVAVLTLTPNRSSTAVPIWGQTILIPSDVSRKRDWGPNRVKEEESVVTQRCWGKIRKTLLFFFQEEKRKKNGLVGGAKTTLPI